MAGEVEGRAAKVMKLAAAVRRSDSDVGRVSNHWPASGASDVKKYSALSASCMDKKLAAQGLQMDAMLDGGAACDDLQLPGDRHASQSTKCNASPLQSLPAGGSESVILWHPLCCYSGSPVVC